MATPLLRTPSWSASRARAMALPSSWRPPLLAWLAVAGFNLGTAAMKGVWTTREASLQWWASPDAAIPELSARWLLYSEPFLPGGRWHVSDRGPLQPLLLLWAGGWSTHPVPAYIVGVIANSAWVVGLWWFLRALDVAEDRIRWTVAFVALTGSIWFNTVYPWPKLLAGALALGCAACILERRARLAGLLTGLALLAHGSALFGIVALVPWAISRLGKRSLIVLGLAGAVYVPWTVFGRIADPPGDRLIKWHYAGTDIDEPDTRNAVVAVADSYADAGPDVVRYKVRNLRLALGDPTVWGGDMQRGTPGWLDDGPGRLRTYQVTRIIWAPGTLLLGLVGWRRVPKTLWLMLGASLAAFVVLEWGGVIEATTWAIIAPMMLVIGWVAACALGTPRWMLPAQLAVFVGLWLLAPPVVA